MNAKFGFRKNNNTLDWNRFLLSQQQSFFEAMRNGGENEEEEKLEK